MAIEPSILGILTYSIIISLECLIGLILLLRTRKAKVENLIYLICFNFLISASFLLSMLNTYIPAPPYAILFSALTYLASVFLMVFTKKVFYQECKKEPFKYIFFSTTAIFVVAITILFFKPTDQPFELRLILNLLFTCRIMIPGYWFGYCSLQQYRKLKIQNIEPWIKKRYIFGGIAALSFGSIGWQLFINTIAHVDVVNPDNNLRLISLLLSALMMGIFSIFSFIAWIMPNRIKRYFNRRYKSIDEKDQSEKDLLENIKQQLSKSDV